MPFIASGSFGCVFGPPLKCDNNVAKSQKTRLISKVFNDDSDFKDEKDIQKKIEKIDPEHKFTIPYYGDCTVTKIRKSNAADKCEHIDMDTKKTYKQLLYQFGGKDFVDFMGSRKGSIASFKKILIPFHPVIKGLKIISDQNMVHLDIKPDNILHYKNSVFLIDFGLMMEKNKVFNQKHILDHDYPFYPPEFKMYVYKNNSFNKFFERFFSNFKYKYIINSQREDIYHIITNQIGYTREEQEKDFIELANISKSSSKNFTGKIDVYSIGIVLAMLYSWSKFNDAKQNSKIKEMTQNLIKGMICFDPVKRFDINELCNKYDELISELKN
jgi:serine/threonine protein kinase